MLYCNIGANYQLESALLVITGSQLRAARGLLNLSVAELAERTGLAINTIRRAEGTNDVAAITTGNMRLLAKTFHEAGIIFIEADVLGVGVRLAAPHASEFQKRRREE
jgi:transcriptional regulator with XRE-family HTH domain